MSCFSTVKLPLPFHTLFFQSKSLSAANTQRRGELSFSSWSRGYQYKLFGILLYSRFVSSPPFIYFVVIISKLAFRGFSCWFQCPFDTPPSFCFTLLFDITRCSRLTLCISCPSPRICHFFKEP